jgi:hypothetical protein
MRRFVPLALGLMIAVAPVQPVLAAADKDKDKSTAQTIALQAVALPIIVDGQLINYVFCSIRLDLYPNADGATQGRLYQGRRGQGAGRGHAHRVRAARARGDPLGDRHQAELAEADDPAALAAESHARDHPLDRSPVRRNACRTSFSQGLLHGLPKYGRLQPLFCPPRRAWRPVKRQM